MTVWQVVYVGAWVLAIGAGLGFLGFCVTWPDGKSWTLRKGPRYYSEGPPARRPPRGRGEPADGSGEAA